MFIHTVTFFLVTKLAQGGRTFIQLFLLLINTSISLKGLVAVVTECNINSQTLLNLEKVKWTEAKQNCHP